MINVNFDITPSELSLSKMLAIQYWEKSDLEVLGHFHTQFPNRLDQDLEKQGYHTAGLSEEIVDTVKNARRRHAKTVALDNRSDIGFVSTDLSTIGLLENYQKGSRFVRPTVPLLAATHDLLGSISKDVAEQLGSPWRVLMARFWETESSAKPEHMYGWHTDGMPHQFFKIMIYFGPMNPTLGSLAIKISGETKTLESNSPGTWVLFKNSSLFHRGVPPSRGGATRFAAEITIARSFNFDFTPWFAGNTAHYPHYPWVTTQLNNPVQLQFSQDQLKTNEQIEPSPLSVRATDYRNDATEDERRLASLICLMREMSGT